MHGPSGRSKGRQALAERALPFSARIVPVGAKSIETTARAPFEPLGYAVDTIPIATTSARQTICPELTATVRLDALLRHVLVPVIDDAGHRWSGADEVADPVDRSAGWLGAHPVRALIARCASKGCRGLAEALSERLDAAPERPGVARETGLEKPLNLHDRRPDKVRAGAARERHIECRGPGIDDVV